MWDLDGNGGNPGTKQSRDFPILSYNPARDGSGISHPGTGQRRLSTAGAAAVHPQSVSAPQIEEEFAQRELGCLGDAGPGKNEVVKGTSSLS